MARCETCGNEYSGTFGVNLAGELHTFDCFECAIHLLAPECAHCGCKVLEGSGYSERIKDRELAFCCIHCAASYKQSLGLK